MKQIGLFLVLIALSIASNSQLAINSALTPTQVVQTLLGPGVDVTNITFSGPAASLGTFNGTANNFGMTAGIIMANGDVANAIGPNNSGSSSLGGGNFGITDPDIDLLDPNYEHNDAAVLEFDFVATGDVLSFNYIWASEEYPEYSGALDLCGDVSDAFGFFISGPGITGIFSNNSANVAIIPGSTDFVSINNLNAGCNGTALPGSADCNYCQYYVNNGDGFSPPYNGSSQYIQYDGFTTVLQAVSNLICGETYHIKLVLADASDTAWDSAVFFEEGSFEISLLVALSPIIEPVQDLGDGQLIEGCVGGSMEVSPPCVFTEQTVDLVYSGTATVGVDYTNGGITELTLTPGTPVYIILDPLDDNINDPNETIILSFDYIDFEGNNQTATAQVLIIQAQPLVISIPDIARCEGDILDINGTPSGGYGPYEYIWSTGTETAIESISTYGSFTVTVTEVCNDTISETFIVSPPAPLLVNIPNDQIFICPSGNTTVTAIATSGATPYTYVWTSNSSIESSALYNNLGLGYQFVTALDACGQTAIDSVIIATNSPLMGVDDLELCRLVGTGELADGGSPPYSYTFPEGAFSSSESAVLIPLKIGLFTIIVTDGCGSTVDIPVDVTVCETRIPNIFTPNDDGTNDVFEIEGIEDFPKSTLRIFGRWGNMIYENSNYNNNWNGGEHPEGVYYFLVERSDGKNFEGYVHLIRD